MPETKPTPHTRHKLIDATDPSVPREHAMSNINGPSVIEAPTWLRHAPGRYLMYFAHHLGSHIRLAYADDPAGPWQSWSSGVLHVDDTPSEGLVPHVASPDVHVDHENQRLVMYFHCPVGGRVGGHLPCWQTSGTQKTLLATSADGLTFTVLAPHRAISNSYLRMVRWREHWYGMAMSSQLVRSPTGICDFEVGPNLFGDQRLRHNALLVDGDRLGIWFTRIGDAPERILYSSVELTADWHDWHPSEPVEVLRPTEPWEGAELPVTASEIGPALEPEHALRDPFVFDAEGRRWMIYAAAGESALGAVQLHVGPAS